MRTFAIWLFAAALLASSFSADAKSPGMFITAGPTNTTDGELTVQWRFGFHFTIDPETISDVTFTCDPIPGSTVNVKFIDLKPDAQGDAYVLTAPTPLSKDATPWLYDPETTSATCVATVTTTKGKRLKEQAPLRFSGATKAVLVMQFQEAYKFNHH